MAVAVIVFMSFIGQKAYAESVYACGYGCSNLSNKVMTWSRGYNQGRMFSVVDYKTKTVHTYLADKYFDNNGEMSDRVVKIGTSTAAVAALGIFLNASASAKSIKITLPANLQNTSNNDGYISSIALIRQHQTVTL